jgi:hypothetical protein
VSLPTYASWLNWIEAEFAAVRYFALNGTDHRKRTHAEQDAPIGAYTGWRNQRIRPKTGFATNSKIRHPDARSRLRDEALVVPRHHQTQRLGTKLSQETTCRFSR